MYKPADKPYLPNRFSLREEVAEFYSTTSFRDILKILKEKGFKEEDYNDIIIDIVDDYGTNKIGVFIYPKEDSEKFKMAIEKATKDWEESVEKYKQFILSEVEALTKKKK